MVKSFRLSLTIAALLVVCTSVPPAVARTTTAANGPPNIVVVMVDDLAAGPAERLFERLPSIRSRFLERGIRFTRAVGETPLCCPGRAGFLSGRHTHRHGVTDNEPGGFDQSRTIATALHDVGYWTMLVGKYFNNASQLDLPPPGWDHFEMVRPEAKTADEGIRSPDATVEVAARAPAVLAEAPLDRPLFMLVTPSAPHNASGSYLPRVSPVHAGDERCQGIGRWDPPSYNEPDVSDKPAYTQQLPLLPFKKGWPLRRHCEQLLSVDDTVGYLEDELRARGSLSDTVWLLLSDNGMTYGEHRWPFKLSPYATPLPLWASWPAGRGIRARDEDQLVSNIDLGPSLATLGGATMPWADGVDWSPLLRDRSFVMARESVLISLPDGNRRGGPEMGPVPGWWGVRTADDWLYVEWATEEKELYDLTSDPWKLENLAGQPLFASRQASLEAAVAAQRNAP